MTKEEAQQFLEKNKHLIGKPMVDTGQNDSPVTILDMRIENIDSKFQVTCYLKPRSSATFRPTCTLQHAIVNFY
jgi:hypothetical protein